MSGRAPVGLPGAVDVEAGEDARAVLTMRRRVVSPSLVGRADELSQLASAVAERPSVVIVEGEAGIGKSRLIEELRAHPDMAGQHVLVGWCRRIQEPFPLGPVLDAIQGSCDALARAELSPVAGALRPLLPELAEFLPPQPTPLEDRQAERHRVFRGLIELLDASGPATLVLEDAHWADDHTLDFLEYALADPPETLALVVTFRDEEVDPRLRTITARLPSRVGGAQIALGPLDAPGTGALAGAILGVERVSDEFSTYLCERTAGIPLAIEELLALLRERGDVTRRGGRWAIRLLDRLDVPIGIRNQVLERVERMSDDARTVIEAAAILQVPVGIAVLAETCGVDQVRVLGGVEEGLKAGVLAEHGLFMGVRHPLASQAVQDAIFGPRRQELHSRAANALRVLDPVPLGRLAHHLQHAGRVDEWIEAAERAADQAVALGNDAEATRLLEEVLRFATLEPERLGRMAIKLAIAAMGCNSAEDVVDLVTQVLQHELPRTLRGELRFRLVLLLEHTGADVSRLRPQLLQAVDDLEDRPELQAWAMMGLGILLVPGVTAVEYGAWTKRALDQLPQIDAPVFRLFLLGKAAQVLSALGDREWRRLSDEIVRQTSGTPQHSRVVTAYLSVAESACLVGHLDTARTMLVAGLEGAIAVGRTPLELRARARMALLDYERGAWEGLAERARVLVEQLAGYMPGRLEAEVVVSCLALAQGELDEAHRGLADVSERTERRGGTDLLPIPSAALIRLLLARGQADAAGERARALLASVGAVGLWVPAVRALPAVVEALAAGGEPDDARALIDRLRRELLGLDAPLAVPSLAHATGLIEAAVGAGQAGAEHLSTAAERYDRAGFPYEAAQAREQAAAALAGSGADDERRASFLQAALTTYQELGAAWDLARISRAAREHGVSVPTRHRGGRRGYGGELSPRQREVAELAAVGRTNKEIAAELFLSPSTVNQHVVAAMRKLGVHSRTALASRLLTEDRSG